MAGPGIRAYQWRDVMVVAIEGDLDVESATRLGRYLARLQRQSTVFLDLWDVTYMDPLAIRVVASGKLRAEATGWQFAVIAPEGGLAAQEIADAGLDETLPTYATKHDAVVALQKS
jgi:glutaminase